MAGVTAPNPAGAASTADLLTALKNVATAINFEAQTTLNIAGLASLAAITGSSYTQVKGAAGRLCVVSVTTAGSTTGTVYDAITGNLGVVLTTRPIYIIPEAIGVYVVNIPVNYGIVVAPGTGQVLTVSYS